MGGFSDNRASVIAFVNVKIVVAQAGWIGATDDDARLQARPVSRRPRQGHQKRIAVYAFDTGAFVRRTTANSRADPIHRGAAGIKCSGTGLR